VHRQLAGLDAVGLSRVGRATAVDLVFVAGAIRERTKTGVGATSR